MNEGTLFSLLNSFYDEYEKENFRRCLEIVSFLKGINYAGTEYYEGLAYYGLKDYDLAEKNLIKVKNDDLNNADALEILAEIYSELGDVKKLIDTLNGCDSINKITKLCLFLRSLIKAGVSSEYKQYIKEFSISKISIEECQEEDAFADFFVIFDLFAANLVIAIDQIRTCLEYQLNNNEPIKSFKKTSDTEHEISVYCLCCDILEYSKVFDFIGYGEGMDSLADAVLKKYDWPEKLMIFGRDDNYIKQIVNVLLFLYSPELHKKTDLQTLLNSQIEKLLNLYPESLQDIVNKHFQIIIENYNDNPIFYRCLNHVYCEIKATKTDRYGLKNKLDTMVNGNISKEDLMLFDCLYHLPWKTKTILRKAENNYEAALKEKGGSEDYSHIPLNYIRTIESEYHEKLINPLVDSIDFTYFDSLISKDDAIVKNLNIVRGTDFKNYWVNEKKMLDDVKNGKMPEIGSIRTFLYHVVGGKKYRYACSYYLYGRIKLLLTQAGVNALKTKTMMKIIDDETLSNYRVPGAHPGFIPRSKAISFRNKALDDLSMAIKWFK